MKIKKGIVRHTITYQNSPSEYHMFERVKSIIDTCYNGLKEESKQLLSFQFKKTTDNELLMGDIRTSCFTDHIQEYNLSDFHGSKSLMNVITSDFLNFQEGDPNWNIMNYIIELITEFELEEVLPEYYDQFAFNRKTLSSNEKEIIEPTDKQNNEGNQELSC